MDYSIPKELELLRKTVKEFAEKEIAPVVEDMDREGKFPEENIKKMAKLGLMGLPISRKYGGAGAGMLGYCIAVEEIGKVCNSHGTILGAHISLCCMPIEMFGTEAQKQKYLVPLAKGEKLGAFALTEPNAGSDAAAIETTAIRDGNYYVLNGTKIWITNADRADIIIVLTVTDKALGARGGVTAFIVEKGTPGLSVGTLEDKMGIRGSSTAELIFEDCKVPKENVLGDVGAGFIVFMKGLDCGRLSLAAGCVGGAQACLDASIKFAMNRIQFGKPIWENQAIQWMIADMATEVYAARNMVYHAIWLRGTGKRFTKESAMCKLFASEILCRAIDTALQIHGGMGYMKKFPIERMYRDARITRIYEGTNEIQRLVIANMISREMRKS